MQKIGSHSGISGLNRLYFFTRFLFMAALLVLTPALVRAQVDNAELQKNQAPVEFISYVGPHAWIETTAQIRNIGYVLGVSVRTGLARPGGSNRYFVIHSVSPAEGDTLDADIFGLGVDVGVDHIVNLRSIIQGYLEAAYDYNARDAALLAQYVTIYNAVYRGDWSYFEGRYKKPVMQELVREKAGLSIRYDEWPGQTLMLIPLGHGGAGSLSALDTSSLTDERVKEQMRQEDDRGVDQRQEMVNLKEREADEAAQKADAQKEAIKDEEKRIADEKETIAQEREQVRKDEESGKISPAEADKKEQELAEREKEVAKQEETLEDQKEEARKNEDFAEQKTAEARQEREEIAKDQQEIIDGEDTRGQDSVAGILGASLPDDASTLGRIVRINTANSAELKRSPMNTVNIRTVSTVNGKLLAVAGENKGSGAIRLIEIDNNTLEMTKQGNDDIHPQSLLWVNGSDLYALNVSGGSVYLARFSTDLALQSRSAVTVHPWASVNIQGDMLLTQRTNGSAVILNVKDLTVKK